MGVAERPKLEKSEAEIFINLPIGWMERRVSLWSMNYGSKAKKEYED